VTAGVAYQIAVDGLQRRTGQHRPPPEPRPQRASRADRRRRQRWNLRRPRPRHLERPAGATAYEIWRNTSNSTTSAVKISAADVIGTTYDDTTTIAGTTYYYWVKAKNAGGTSGFSAANTGYGALAALPTTTSPTARRSPARPPP